MAIIYEKERIIPQERIFLPERTNPQAPTDSPKLFESSAISVGLVKEPTPSCPKIYCPFVDGFLATFS
jgi:hypothetical protein